MKNYLKNILFLSICVIATLGANSANALLTEEPPPPAGQATLKIIKHTNTPDSKDFYFNVYGPTGGRVTVTTTTGAISGLWSAGSSSITVDAGPYSILEDNTVGWRLEKIACTSTDANGNTSLMNATIDIPTMGVSLAIEIGHTVSCIFDNSTVNPPPPPNSETSITINEISPYDSIPSCFDGNLPDVNSSEPGDQCLNDSGYTWTLSPGTYEERLLLDLSRTIERINLSGIPVDNTMLGNPQGNWHRPPFLPGDDRVRLNLAEGMRPRIDFVVALLTLPPPPPTPQGTLEIIKETGNPNDNDSFIFNVAGPTPLNGVVVPTINGEGTSGDGPVDVSTANNKYSITEMPLDGWGFNTVSCKRLSNNDPTGVLIANGAGVNNIDVFVGDTTICMFTNTKITPPPPPPVVGTCSIICSYITNSSNICNNNGIINLCNTFYNWTYNITNNITNTINNYYGGGTSQATINIIKIAKGSDGTDSFNFEIYENSTAQTPYAKKEIITSQKTSTPGEYTGTATIYVPAGKSFPYIKEALPVGNPWNPDGLSCSDASGNPVSDKTLFTGGEVVNCTFKNSKATMIIVKKATGGDGTDSFRYDLYKDPTKADTYSTATLNIVADKQDKANATLYTGSTSLSILIGSAYPHIIEENSSGNGFTLKKLVCLDQNNQPVCNSSNTNGNLTCTITKKAAPGDVITCTFENSKPIPAVLIINKNATGSTKPTKFTYFMSGPNFSKFPTQYITTDTSGFGSTGKLENVVPGEYSISEPLIPGWNPLSVSCVTTGNGGTIKGLVTNGIEVTIIAGETTTCTFNNASTSGATMVIVKKATGGDGTDSFRYDLYKDKSKADKYFPATLDVKADELDQNNKNLYNGFASISVPVGSEYPYIEEAVSTTGFTLKSVSCVDQNDQPVTNIKPAAPGDVITCTFENSKASKAQGALKIVKKTIGGDASFKYNIYETIVSSALTPSPVIKTSKGTGETTSSIMVNPGKAYVIEEVATIGWQLVSVSCAYQSDKTTGEMTGNSIKDVSVIADETTTCTFINKISLDQGTLKIVKKTIGGDDEFEYIGYDSMLNQIAIFNSSIETLKGAGQISQSLDASSSYIVKEVATSGWLLSGFSCKLQSDDSTGTTTGNSIKDIVVNSKETTTCTFVNTKAGTTQTGRITIVKNTTGGIGSFDFDDNFGLGQLTTVGTSSGGSATWTSTDLAIGSKYFISEINIPSGWTQDGVTCDNGTPTAINVVAGGNTTCTFTNKTSSNQGILKIVKKASGGDDTFYYDITSPKTSVNITTINGDGYKSINLNAGIYSINENTLAGWNFETASCEIQALSANDDFCNKLDDQGCFDNASNGCQWTTVSTTSDPCRDSSYSNIGSHPDATTCNADTQNNCTWKCGKDSVSSFGRCSNASCESYLTGDGNMACNDGLFPAPAFGCSNDSFQSASTYACIYTGALAGGGINTGNLSGSTVSGVMVKAGQTTVCTFTNTNTVSKLTITSIDPSSITACSSDPIIMTISGTGFRTDSLVKFGQQTIDGTFVSDIELTVDIDSGTIGEGRYSLTVVNPNPDGGTSNAMEFTVTSSGITSPTLTEINASQKNVGDQEFKMVATGTGFTTASVVNFENELRMTAFDSSTQLTAQIPASDMLIAGTFQISISMQSSTSTGSSCGAGNSNTKPFIVYRRDDPPPDSGDSDGGEGGPPDYNLPLRPTGPRN